MEKNQDIVVVEGLDKTRWSQKKNIYWLQDCMNRNNNPDFEFLMLQFNFCLIQMFLKVNMVSNYS